MKKILFLFSAASLGLLISCNDQEAETLDQENAQLTIKDEASGTTYAPIAGQYIVVLQEGGLSSEISSLKINTNKRVTSKSDYLSKTSALKNELISKQKHFNFDQRKIKNVFMYSLEGFVANLTEAEANALKKDSRVKSVQQDYLITLGKPGGGTTAPAAQEIPWGITRIGGAGDGTGKTAWVIDSGIDLDHPDLNVDTSRSVSFVTGDSSANDANGHGTHVAGTIAALNNNIGVVGVAAGAKVVALRVLGSDGSGEFSWTVQALDLVKASGQSGDVVNMSLGPENRYTDTAVDDATLSLAQAGIKIAIAAGNSKDDSAFYSPARNNHANIYTVSAFAKGDFWAYFSNYNNNVVDFSAPGYAVKSCWLNGGYNTINGTSMASPHVAGILLLGNINTDGNVKNGYWEVNRRGQPTGNISATNTFGRNGTLISDPDGTADKIAHR